MVPLIRLAALLVFVQVADVVTTLVGLSVGASEDNPVVVRLLEGGPWLFLVAKVVGTGLILVTAAYVAENVPHGSVWARHWLLWSCVFMLGVVLWNVSVIAVRLGA